MQFDVTSAAIHVCMFRRSCLFSMYTTFKWSILEILLVHIVCCIAETERDTLNYIPINGKNSNASVFMREKPMQNCLLICLLLARKMLV